MDMDFNKVTRLQKDIRQAASTLSKTEARYLVDCYYQTQEHRIATAAQSRTLSKSGEPNAVIDYLTGELSVLENEIKKALQTYAENDPVGRWSLSVCGIGPVLAAGLLAHIDIEKAPTAGHIWSFAGLEPNTKWEKGQKRPWNASLKVICWKIGQSFVKVSSNDKDIYGKLWKDRKEYEMAKNEAGDYAEQAALKLTQFKIGKDTEAYKWYAQGKLPPAHIQQRTERYATKIFLAHWQHVAYFERYGSDPPKPYAIAILGHAHEILVPNYVKYEEDTYAN